MILKTCLPPMAPRGFTSRCLIFFPPPPPSFLERLNYNPYPPLLFFSPLPHPHSSLLQVHVRFLKTDASNYISTYFGHRRPTAPAFNKQAHRLFHKHVYDPQLLADSESSNLCVPLSIVITLFKRFSTLTLKEISPQQLVDALSALRYEKFLAPGPEGGIDENDFRDLERLNSPFTEQLLKQFPQLANYNHLALNLFRIEMSTDDKGIANSCGYIFPCLLSIHNNNAQSFQIDMLRDCKAIRPTSYDTKTGHVLVIPNMPRFIAVRNLATRLFAHKMTHLCRHCLRVFSNPQVSQTSAQNS